MLAGWRDFEKKNTEIRRENKINPQKLSKRQKIHNYPRRILYKGKWDKRYFEETEGTTAKPAKYPQNTKWRELERDTFRVRKNPRKIPARKNIRRDNSRVEPTTNFGKKTDYVLLAD